MFVFPRPHHGQNCVSKKTRGRVGSFPEDPSWKEKVLCGAFLRSLNESRVEWHRSRIACVPTDGEGLDSPDVDGRSISSSVKEIRYRYGPDPGYTDRHLVWTGVTKGNHTEYLPGDQDDVTTHSGPPFPSWNYPELPSSLERRKDL